MASKQLRTIITGGSSGVGAALAKHLAAAGAKVFIVGRNETSLKAVASECGPDVCGYGVGDVSADCERLWAESVSFFGSTPMNSLVANAGCSRRGTADTVTEEDYDIVMNTNVKGVFVWVHRAIQAMKKSSSGQIVVTSSVLGERTVPNGALYCASKFAVQGFVGCVRKDLVGSGIKIGTVNPGAIATPWWHDPSRGDWDKAAPAEETMLATEAVVDAISVLLNQSATSDIERIVLDPAGRRA